MADIPVQALAQRLFDAAATGSLVSPISDELPDLTEADGYRIQDALVALHVAAGSRVVGAKLGLTSRAKQREMGISEPIHGWLLDSMSMDPGVPLEVAGLGQPRAEPEIAFLMARDLGRRRCHRGPGARRDRGRLPGARVLDSRYRDYRFTLPDVVADQTSAGRFVLAGTLTSPRGLDLALTGCVFSRNGEIVATAAGAAALGHPAAAVAWLVRRLAASGRGLRAGDIVLTGGLTAVVPLKPGDVVSATFDRLGSVTLACR